jgi:hypothetical protein
VPGQPAYLLTAPTRTPTTHTPVAAPVPRHDRAADMAAWSITQVDKIYQRVGGVVKTTINKRRAFGYLSRGRLRSTLCSKTALRWRGFAAGLAECCVLTADCFRFWLLTAERSGAHRRQNHIFEQRILPAGNEPQLQPAEDVVHDALGDGDLRVAGEARRLKARVAELFAHQLHGDAVLQRQ